MGNKKLLSPEGEKQRGIIVYVVSLLIAIPCLLILVNTLTEKTAENVAIPSFILLFAFISAGIIMIIKAHRCADFYLCRKKVHFSFLRIYPRRFDSTGIKIKQ